MGARWYNPGTGAFDSREGHLGLQLPQPGQFLTLGLAQPTTVVADGPVGLHPAVPG